MELDAAIHALLHAGFALLFLAASAHKFSNRLQFQGVLAAYRLFPPALVPLLAIAVPLIELGLGLAWAANTFTSVVALASATLLAFYALAIGINLARGRTEIDCGCSFSASTANKGISGHLVARNGVLVVFALLATVANNERVLSLIDFAGIGLAALALLLMYGAVNQLIANQQVIASWRTPLLRQEKQNA